MATATIKATKLRVGKAVNLRINLWNGLSPAIAAGTPYYATITLTDAFGNSVFAVDPTFQISTG